MFPSTGGSKQMLVIFCDAGFYILKRLFSTPAPSFVSQSEEVTHVIAQLSDEEKDILTSPFTEEAVFEAISNMEHNKAPARWVSCGVLSKNLASH
jgi:hypothetical protein